MQIFTSIPKIQNMDTTSMSTQWGLACIEKMGFLSSVTNDFTVKADYKHVLWRQKLS